MDQRHAERLRGFRHRTRSPAIDREGEVALVLGLVDRRIGRRRHHRVGPRRLDRAEDGRRIGEIQLGPPQRDDFMPGQRAALG